MIAIQDTRASRSNEKYSERSFKSVERNSVPMLEEIVVAEVVAPPLETTAKLVAAKHSAQQTSLQPCITFAVVAFLSSMILDVVVVSAIGVREEQTFEWLSYTMGWISVPTIACMAGGMYLVRTSQPRLGGLLLAFGFLVAASPLLLFRGVDKSISQAAEDAQQVVVTEQDGQQVARHPHLRFSFPLVAGLSKNDDVANRFAAANPKAPKVHAFTREETLEGNPPEVKGHAIVTCFVTPPIWGPPSRIDRYLTEYLESTNRAAPIEWTHKTGSGYESDVRIAQNMKGVYTYTRILTTLAEDGRRHLVILSSTGLNEEETRLTLEGLVTTRQ